MKPPEGYPQTRLHASILSAIIPFDPPRRTFSERIVPPRIRWTAFFLVLLGTTAPCRAQAFVEHMEPPALERGKTTRVTLVGASFGKALDLWTSLPRGAIKATPIESTPTRVAFDVTVANDAPVGISGGRLATVDGLGNAFLFLIDDLPVRPAPVATSPTKVTLPVALWGRVREAAVDRFAIDVAAGERVSFEAVGSRLGKDVDPLITIRDSKGHVVVERDNDPGLYFDFRFEHTFATAGTYTIEIRDARFHGAAHHFYVLRMGRFPAARIAVPMVVRPGGKVDLKLPELADVLVPLDVKPRSGGLFFGTLRRPSDQGSTWLPLEASDADVTVHQEPSSTIENATPAKVPGALCGVLRKPGDRHFYRLDLGKGQKIQVRAEAKPFNSPADLELAITDAKGKELRRVVENAQEEIVLDFNTGNPAVYGLRVGDVNRDGGPAFAYRLDVRGGQSRIDVTAEVEGLTVPRGSYQPIPLTVTRTDYAGPIALSLVDAPSGVTLTPTEIDGGVNAIVCRLSASTEAPLGAHTLQIVARPTDAPPVLVRTRPLIDRQIVNVDLIPHALREDQRRLPPEVSDRFAVQVTPAAPFTVELPEPLAQLGRYQHVDFPIVMTRVAGFDGPIRFTAKGGQIAPKDEGRTRVYAEFPEAGADKLQVTGAIHSRILTNLVKHRVEVTAVGRDRDRQVSLTRTFDLDIRSAFIVKAEPPSLKLEPGTSAKLRLVADRMKTFDGEVAVQLSPSPGLDYPERIVIPAGKGEVEIEMKVDPNRAVGRQQLIMTATGVVGSFEEEQRGSRLDIEVVKSPAKKK
jgi:hypothetical protein